MERGFFPHFLAAIFHAQEPGHILAHHDGSGESQRLAGAPEGVQEHARQCTFIH